MMIGRIYWYVLHRW